MENEINMKENDFKVLLENKQIEVIEYNKKINELINQKNELENSNIDLNKKLIRASEELNKIKNYIQENSSKQNFENQENKNSKENKPNNENSNANKKTQENQNISIYNNINSNNLINNNIILNKSNFDSPNRNNLINKDLNQSKSVINMDSLRQTNLSNSKKDNLNQNINESNIFHNYNMKWDNQESLLKYQKFKDPKEDKQIQILEEFKQLLDKIDEKLDQPLLLKK